MMEIDPLTGMPKAAARAAAANSDDVFMRAFSRGPYSNPLPTPGMPGGPGAPAGPKTPDYAGLINNDPLLQQLRKDLGAQGIQDAAGRAAATQRALVLFGQVPQFDQLSGLNPEWLNQDVTDQTRQMAAQNTEAGLSVSARQKQAFDKQIREIRNALAARGALRSGEFSHQLQEAQRGFDQAKYDTTQELIDFISGLQAGFAQQERARQMELARGAQDAANRVPDQPAPVAAPAPVAVDPLSGILGPPRPTPAPRGGGGGGGQWFMVD